jgi:hypothetical protein
LTKKARNPLVAFGDWPDGRVWITAAQYKAMDNFLFPCRASGGCAMTLFYEEIGATKPTAVKRI